MSLEERARCLYQVFRPRVQIPWQFRKPGTGDCMKCEADESNKYCASYVPIKLYVFEVKADERGR